MIAHFNPSALNCGQILFAFASLSLTFLVKPLAQRLHIMNSDELSGDMMEITQISVIFKGK